ncbi:NAD-dependent epimerase/dehydratase family protein [Thalassotalea fusca]
MRVLVTGAQGFLGSHIVSRLAKQGIEVIGLTRQDCDLSDLNQVKQTVSNLNAELIIHCAAFVPKSLLEYESETLTEKNILLIDNLLDSTDCPIVYISSMTVYGSNGVTLKKESESPYPESAYAQSKYQGELCLKRSERNALSIRIPGLFGDGRASGLIYNNLKKASQGAELSLPDKPLLWAAMDVEDAAQSIVKIIKQYRFNGFDIINLGYSDAYSINKLVDIVNQLFNGKFSYDVVHPEFQFELTKLKELKANPEVVLFDAIQKYKGKIC